MKAKGKGSRSGRRPGRAARRRRRSDRELTLDPTSANKHARTLLELSKEDLAGTTTDDVRHDRRRGRRRRCRPDGH